jgi:Xaa-Pro aminopeptidase
MRKRDLPSTLLPAILLGLSLPTTPIGPAPLAAQSNVAFAPEVYRAHRARLMAEIGDAAAIIPSRYLIGEMSWGDIRMDPDFWYLTGLETVYSILVVTPERTAVFVPDEHQFLGGQYPMADFDEFRYARWNRPGPWRITPGADGAEVSGIDEVYALEELDDRLGDLLAGVRAVYLSLDDRPLYAPPGFAPPLTVSQQMVNAFGEHLGDREMRDLDPIMTSLRVIKDEYEIDALRRAAQISALGLVEAMREVRPGMNDMEVAGLMEQVWKQEGSPRPGFEIIVKSGTKMQFFTITNEQYNPADRVMQDGELLFVDYGAAEYMTYTSDLCRTFPVSGHFSDEQRKYYDIVDEARRAAIATIEPGVMLVDVVRAAAEVFQRHGLEDFENIEAMGADQVWGMMPSPTHYLTREAGIVPRVRALGHFIGLEVGDPGDATRPLEAGMVFTVEPKIYIPGKNISIMIEDMVLVTEDGHEVLSAGAPTSSVEIERLMAEGRR